MLPSLDKIKPVLVIVCGLIGTGKSTIAAALAQKTGYTVLRSDTARKELAGLRAGEHRYVPFGGGIYSEEFFDKTYDALLKETLILASKGQGVIIDASFKKTRYRENALAISRDAGVPFLLVECTCSEREIRKRLKARLNLQKEISDGRWEIYREQKADFEEVTELPESEHLILNTVENLDANIGRIAEAIDRLTGLDDG